MQTPTEVLPHVALIVQGHASTMYPGYPTCITPTLCFWHWLLIDHWVNFTKLWFGSPKDSILGPRVFLRLLKVLG